MRQARSPRPVTVKCRIGVDDQDPEVALRALIRSCAEAGVTSFAVHARKAWLEGLSPKENRDVPPLDYDLVARVKAENPALEIVLNGGIQSLEQAETHLTRFDGVMLGRAAYQDPAMLLEVDTRFFGAGAARSGRGDRRPIAIISSASWRNGVAPPQHDQAYAGAVQRPARRPGLPPPSQRKRHARGCRQIPALREALAMLGPQRKAA